MFPLFASFGLRATLGSQASLFGANLPLYLPGPVYWCLLEYLKYERTIKTSSLPKEGPNCETAGIDGTTKDGGGCTQRTQRTQYRTSGPVSIQVAFNLLGQLLTVVFS